jgi:hypothetical protein
MARGFESKAVADQLDAAENKAAAAKLELSAADRVRQSQVAGLKLQRSRILDARTANPQRRAALQSALEHVEQQLTALGVTDLA